MIFRWPSFHWWTGYVPARRSTNPPQAALPTTINYNATGDLYIALVRGDESLLLASPWTRAAINGPRRAQL